MMRLRWLIGVAAAAVAVTVVTGLYPSAAFAWTKITSNGYQQGTITAYYYETEGGCTRYDDVCYGSSEYALSIGDAAVHYIGTNHSDPVAPFGSRVDIPYAMTMFWEDGSYDDLQSFWVYDTGAGTSTSGNGWVDIYCGDGWESSPNYNQYYYNNVQQVIGTYGDGSKYNNWFVVK